MTGRKRKEREHYLHLNHFFLGRESKNIGKPEGFQAIYHNYLENGIILSFYTPATDDCEIKYLLKKQSYAEDKVLFSGLKPIDTVHF